MGRKEEEQLAATLAKAMAMICGPQQHAGGPACGAGPGHEDRDYSDVFVIDADGNHIPWGCVAVRR